MLVKNLTPFVHGAKVTSRRPPQAEMTFVVKGTFSLEAGGALRALEEQPPLMAETFAEGDDERAGECLYPGDFADFKPRAEVLLRGSAHAPFGRPVTELDVRLALGAWSKHLRVFGPRVWSEGALGRSPSEPRSFTRAELSLANAFGGPDSPENPVGKGAGTADLPQVELPDRRLASPSDALPPASFAPRNPTWRARASLVGAQYDARYRKERAPYYAADFDWAYFQAAPPDQLLPGYAAGDEELVLQHLHASAPTVRGRLPGRRVRVFVRDAAGKIREVPMNLDTVLVEPDEDHVTLVWRGLTPVGEADLTDVKFVLVADEALAEKPLPARGYHERLDAFAEDPVGLKEKMPAGFDDFVDRTRREKAGEVLPEDPSAPDPVTGMLKKRFGSFAPDIQAEVAAGMKAGGPPSKELTEKLAAAKAPDEPPVAVIKRPGTLPHLGLRRMMRQVLEESERLKKSFEGREMPPEVAAKIAEIERIPHDPAWPKIEPSYRPPVEPLSSDEPGPFKNLAERDLSYQDLSGKDLSGVNLEEALLVGANLRGAKLVGANLRRAILYKADLSGADLSGADLTQTNAAQARAVDARLSGCLLEMTYLDGAELEGADLSKVTGSYPSFVGAGLRRARFGGADVDRADLTEAVLDEADVSGATLTNATFERTSLRKTSLARSKLDGSRFQEADLTGANLSEARGERTIWALAKLDKADLSDAWFRSSHFPEVSARATSFVRANLRLARLYRACLAGANLSDANLFGADLSRAEVTDTKFLRANLYDAKLFEAHGEGSDFTDANISRSTMESL